MEFWYYNYKAWGSPRFVIPKDLNMYSYLSSTVKLKEDLQGQSSKVKSTYGERSRCELAFRYTVQGVYPGLTISSNAILTSGRTGTQGWFPLEAFPSWVKGTHSVPDFPYVYILIMDYFVYPFIPIKPTSVGGPIRVHTGTCFRFGGSTWYPKNLTSEYGSNEVLTLNTRNLEPEFPTIELDFPQIRTVAEIVTNQLSYQTAVRKLISKTNATLAQNAKALSINGLAFLGDILNLKETISQITSLATRLGSISNLPIRKILAIPADAKLIDSYVVKTTMSDLTELWSALQRYRNFYATATDSRIYTARAVERSSDAGSWNGWSYDLTISEKVRYDSWDQATLPFMRLLQSMDFFPSFTNVWDLVPFSFVIDWLYPVNEILSQMDTDTYVSNLPLREVLYSCHTRISRDSWPSESRIKDIRISFYHRHVRRELPEGSPYLPKPEHMSMTHVPEATALLIQQIANR